MRVILLGLFSLWLIFSILIQKPKQESLDNALGNTYKTKLDKILTLQTLIVFVILCSLIVL